MSVTKQLLQHVPKARGSLESEIVKRDMVDISNNDQRSVAGFLQR